MIWFKVYFLFVIVPVKGIFSNSKHTLHLKTNSPVVIGGTMQFVAEIFNSKGGLANGLFEFEWEDTASPQNKAKFLSKSPRNVWNVTYPLSVYSAGEYEILVIVKNFAIFKKKKFYLTRTLNGLLQISQDNKTSTDIYLSTNQPAQFSINLKESDDQYFQSAEYFYTYWFIDCNYTLGPSNSMLFYYNFTDSEENHRVDVLIVGIFDKNSNITSDLKNELPSFTLSSNSSLTHKTDFNKTSPGYKNNMAFRYICQNTTVTFDSKKAYGLFNKSFITKAPVSNLTVSGNNWLKNGALLSLSVKCDGSSMFNYCVHWPKGPYNITGNENCLNPDTSEKCEFPIRHFFLTPGKYTIIIVIYNDVSKVVYPVTVTVYRVEKKSQLSIIIVPVTFSLVAAVMIIFGIGYYLQNKSRFIVEVANFNFGCHYADMEYKTFMERLQESIANAFTKAPSPSSSENSVWPPGQKYGSFT